MAAHSVRRRKYDSTRSRQRQRQVRSRHHRHDIRMVRIRLVHNSDHRITRHDIEYQSAGSANGRLIGAEHQIDFFHEHLCFQRAFCGGHWGPGICIYPSWSIPSFCIIFFLVVAFTRGLGQTIKRELFGRDEDLMSMRDWSHDHDPRKYNVEHDRMRFHLQKMNLRYRLHCLSSGLQRYLQRTYSQMINP